MGYKIGAKIDSDFLAAEADLIRQGFSYPEVADMMGTRAKTVSERNRLIHKIDIWEAFRRKIEEHGIDDRKPTDPNFCWWFAGFFDGEGTFIVFTRPCTANPKYSEYRLGIRVMIRDDDAQVVARIKDYLKVGPVSRRRRHGRSNPAIAWTCERVQDLAEVIVPLFEKYPLQTKKAQEFAVWKPLVMARYINTLAGHSNRRGIPEDQRAAFHEAIEAIGRIRTYRSASLAAE
jgi:hypothetical protein